MRKSAFLLMFAVLLVLVSSGSVSATWWNESYTKKILINCTNLDDNTPIVINGSSGFTIDGKKQIVWTYCSGTGTAVYYNDYSDYVVANDTTQLPMEVEFGNGTSYNPTQVWDSNYLAVYHMTDTTTSTITDSTSNDYDCTKKGANEPIESTGEIGQAQDFDGSDDYIACGDINELDTANEITYETYSKLDDFDTTYPRLICKASGTGDAQRNDILFNSPDRIELGLGGSRIAIGEAVTTGTWYYTAGTAKMDIGAGSDKLEIFKNGYSIGSDNTLTLAPVDMGTHQVYIGSFDPGVLDTREWDGLIDEVRISDIVRSDSYFNQTYENIIGTAGYGNLLAEESAPSADAPIITAHTTSPSTVYTNTDFKFNMTATDTDNATFTGWVQFYVNDSATGSVQTNSMNNNTNTLIGTLANANFIKGSELIAEYWASDGENNSTKANQSTVTVSNTAPVFNPALANQNAYSDIEFTYDINATDLDSDTLTYYDNTTLFNINSETGIITDTPTESEKGTYTILITIGDGTDNTTSTFDYTIIDKTPPAITWIQQPDLNLTVETNPTYLYNISDTSGVNWTSVIFYHGLNDTYLNSMNWSYRYPASAKQPDRLRACNRNKSLLLIEDNAIKLYEGDIASYGGHLYGACLKPVVYSSGSDWVAFNMTFDYHHLMESHIPVDKTALHNEVKTDQYINIYKSHPAIVQLETFPTEINRTVNGTYPLLIYGCNNSVNPYTVDYTSDSNCAFYGTRTDFDTKDRISNQSSYVHFLSGIDENGKIGGTSLTPSDTMFMYLDSDAPNVAKGFKLYYADDVVPDNTNFNETYYLHTYSPSSWTNRSETPDVQLEVTADEFDIQYYVFACDNNSNCVNFTMQADALGERPNEAPNAPYLIQPLVNYNITGTYNITWLDGIDPEGDPFNITLVLINHTDSSEYVLTSTISKGTEYYSWDTTAYIDLDSYQIVIYATDSGGLKSLNDTSEGNFTIDNTAPVPSNIGKNDSHIERNDVVKFYANWSDNIVGLSHYIFSWNNSGSWVNDSAVELTSWSNITKTVTAERDTFVSWIIYANDSLNNIGNTGIQNFTVQNAAPDQPVLNAPTDGATDQLLNTTLNITVTDADGDLMNVSFYGVSVSNYIEQENANITSCTGNWDGTHPCGFVSDGDWATYGSGAVGGNPAYLELIYFKLDNSFEMIWQIKDYSGTFNLTIPDSCFSYNEDNVSFKITSDYDDPFWVYYDCWDGSWNRLKSYNDDSWIYEEKVFWIIETLDIIANTTDIPSGSDATFDWSGLDFNTTYEWYAVVTDGTNTTTTPTYNFTTFAFPLSITAGPYPEDDTGVNTLPVNFNLTMLALEDFNCTLMINSTENATGDYTAGADVLVSFDESLPDGYWEYYITCEDKVHGTLLNSTTNTIFVDTQNPTITINPSNAFTATNTSTISNYDSTEFPLNITFEDERDLFAMEINITNSIGHTVFNRTNTSLSGLTYNYTEIVDNSDWTAGLYNIEVIVSDSHTSALIDDYKPIKLTDKLIFDTAEDNKITIEADDAISSDTTKVYDRYLFEFSYPKTKTTDIVYHVKSDNKIYYKPDSGYKAHFIIWNPSTKTGNWVDFEDVALKDYTVRKVSDNDYTVTFKMPAEGIETIKFNSIGGLNVVTENYEWFRGSTAQSYTTPVLTNTTTSFYLNVTNTSSISDINARFFYNYTEYSVTKTTSDDYGFKATITAPALTIGSQVFNFTWNVSINQTDGTQYNFSELNNQTVSTAQINITMLDELNHSLITETLDVYYVGEGRHYTTDTGYILIGNLSPSIPYIEIENDNYPRRGYYITISENITTHLTAYLLRSTASTQETTFTVQDSDLSRIENAKMTFYRMVNMTYVEVGQVETDYAGQAALTLDTTNKYRIVIEATDYPIKTLELRPLQTTYTITLQITGAGFENVFEGIAYTITPTNRSTNVSQNYTDFRLDIYSSNSDLELFGVRTFDHDYVCIPASCTQNITGSPAGGSAIVRVKGNTTGTVKIDVYYKRTDYPITYLNFNIFSFVDALAAHARSLWASMNAVKEDYSPIMLALIAIVGTIMLLGTAAEIGIYGLPLIVIAAFGLIFFALVGFINPLIVGLSLILGGIVYFRFSGGAD